MVGNGSVEANGGLERGITWTCQPHAVIIQTFKKQPQHGFSVSTFLSLQTKIEIPSIPPVL